MTRQSIRVARRFAADAAATLARITILFAFLTIATDAGSRLIAQFSPTWLYFSLSRVEVLPGGLASIVYRKSEVGDLPVSVVTELIADDGRHPCASSGRRLIEAGTKFAIVPLSRLLPDCRWDEIDNGEYRIQMTASYPVAGAYEKSITVESVNRLIVSGGAIAGATVPTDIAG